MKIKQNNKTYIPKFSKPETRDIYSHFFDSDFGILQKNIISYFNNTLNIDSFSITVENLLKDDLYIKLNELGFYLLYKHENLNRNDKQNTTQSNFAIDDFYYGDSVTVFAKENYEAILSIERSSRNNLNVTCFYIQETKNIEELIKFLSKHHRKIDKKVQIITRRSHGYEIQAIDVKKIDIDFDLYYNDDFKYSELKKNIELDENGIIIMSGVPGSGKSSLIKYMIRDIPREFCYLPPNNIELFSDPSSLPFIIQELNNKILIIEDCEKLLRSRDEGDNWNIATILNISDGILGDYLNLKMILTINTTEKIDEALLRKGRLLYSYDFKNLTVAKVNALAKKLGIDKEFTQELPLTDLLNYDKENNATNFVKKKKKIGF